MEWLQAPGSVSPSAVQQSTDPAEDWFLVLVLAVLFLLCLVVSVYILVNFQHPEDKNQAYPPKIVVIVSLTLAMMSVLLLPLDIANRASCTEDVAFSECTFTLPMRDLWFALYMSIFAIVVFVLPFMLFFYESDSEECAHIYSCSILLSLPPMSSSISPTDRYDRA